MKFLMLHCIDEQVLDAVGTENDEALDAWVEEMDSRGIKQYGAHLRVVRDATTVRIRHGEVLITDGPFAETKEQIAGIDVLECASMAEAIELAARHPTARIGTFEIRPFAEP